MNTHVLTAQVFECNLANFLNELAKIDRGDEPLNLDFSSVKYWIPAAIVATCAMVNRWTSSGRNVQFSNYETSQAFTYLQRINFFERVGLKLSESFKRHDSGTSFVEIQEIEQGYVKYNEPLARRLAECLAGTKEASNNVLRLSEFSLGEVIANCKQHSQQTGFISAQYVSARDYARIGVADCGVGILGSFRENNSPHYREGMTHADALEKAMEPWVSSKNHIQTGLYGEPSNRGIGLKMIRHMIMNSFGEMFIMSGNSWIFYKGNTPPEKGALPNGMEFQGTVVSILFPRKQTGDYQQLLQEAQQAVNLTSDAGDDIFFQ